MYILYEAVKWRIFTWKEFAKYTIFWTFVYTWNRSSFHRAVRLLDTIIRHKMTIPYILHLYCELCELWTVSIKHIALNFQLEIEMDMKMYWWDMTCAFVHFIDISYSIYTPTGVSEAGAEIVKFYTKIFYILENDKEKFAFRIHWCVY